MSQKESSNLLNCYLSEYEKLKDEQAERIGFRDNLINATLVAIGGVFAYALLTPTNFQSLLALPLLSFVLGWTYVINDRKISEMGMYIRGEFSQRVKEQISDADARLFRWEFFHMESGGSRMRMKWVQFLVDSLTFVVPGLFAIFSFRTNAISPAPILMYASLAEVALLLYLDLELLLGTIKSVKKLW